MRISDRMEKEVLLPANVRWSGRVLSCGCAATPRIVITARAAQLGR